MFKHYWTKPFSSGSNVPHILKYRRVYIQIHTLYIYLTLNVSLMPCHTVLLQYSVLYVADGHSALSSSFPQMLKC